MSVMTPVPNDHPLMKAWKAYKETEDYKNSHDWATKGIQYMVLPEPKDPNANRYTHDHYQKFIEGSMWAMFTAGFEAAGGKVSV